MATASRPSTREANDAPSTAPNDDSRITALSVYLDACAAAGRNVKPNRELKQLLADPTCQVLQLDSNLLGDTGFSLLCKALPYLPNLRVLSVPNNNLANESIQELCKLVLDANKLPMLQILNIAGNHRVTRTGGQALLNSVGRASSSVCYLNLSGTRVTQYFEVRIQNHVGRNYNKLAETERSEIDALVVALVCGDNTAEMQAQLRRSNAGATPMGARSFHRNNSFDEAICVEDGDLDSQASDAVREDHHHQHHSHRQHRSNGNTTAATSNNGDDESGGRYDDEDVVDEDDNDVNDPDATTTTITMMNADTGDFARPSENNSGMYTITKHKGRTVYGYRTPTPYAALESQGIAPEDVHIFEAINAYTPKEIEPPMKFIFPGQLSFFPAVHAPDPMISPPMPSKVNWSGINQQPTLSPNSMYWNFFQTAGTGVSHNNNNTSPNNQASPLQLDVAVSNTAQNVTLTDVKKEQEKKKQHTANDDDNEATSSKVEAEPSPVPTAMGPAKDDEETPARTKAEPGKPAPKPTGDIVDETPSNQVMRRQDHSDDDGMTDGASLVSPPPAMASHIVPYPALEEAIAENRRYELWKANDDRCSNGNLLDTRPDPAARARQKQQEQSSATNEDSNDLSNIQLRESQSGRLSSMGLSPTRHQQQHQSLTDLIDDPSWVPSQPTGGQQVDRYNFKHKLTYNTVDVERFKVRGDVPREYYLQRLIRHARTEKLTSGNLNSRGTLLATCSYDATCKIWDVDTGQKIHTLTGHEGYLSDCVWNVPKCNKIVTASFDATIRVWSVDSGKCLHTLRGHEYEVVALAMAHNGRLVASGGMDDLAIIWDIEDGEEKCTLVGHEAEVVSLDFSPNDQLIVSGSMDGSVRVWNVKDGTSVHVLHGHGAEVGQVRFNKFGNMVLSGSIDCTCKLWDVESGKHKTLRGHTREVVDCAFSPDGWVCASASEDHTVRLWDVLTGGCLGMMVGHDAGVCHVAFNNTGSELLTGSVDMTAKIWTVDNGRCKQTLRGHKGVVLVSYNENSERIVTISKDNSCRIWRLEPPANTLLHNAALAICQHPTVLAEVSRDGLPDHVKKLLQRMHRKLYQGEKDALRGPTPTPALETPCSFAETETEGEGTQASDAGNGSVQ